MSRNTKIALGVAVGLVLCCCLGVVGTFVILPRFVGDLAGGAIIENGEEAAAVGQSILDYELPAGFQEEGGMEILGMKTVFITPSNQEGMMIMMMQFPAAISGNEAQMKTQMDQALARQTGQSNVNFSEIETRDVTINGEGTTMTIREGNDDEGNSFRQATALFTAKDGNAGMLMIMGAQENWNDGGIDSFITSLK